MLACAANHLSIKKKSRWILSESGRYRKKCLPTVWQAGKQLVKHRGEERKKKQKKGIKGMERKRKEIFNCMEMKK